MMNKVKKYVFISLIILGTVSLLLYINDENYKNESSLSEIIYPRSVCKPQEHVCKINNEKFIAEIEFDQSLFYLKPFNVTIRTQEKGNKHIKSILIDFKMKGMDMGVNRFNLVPNDISDKITHWKGKALLPICVTGRVDWFSEIEIVTSKEKYIYTFPIQVKKTNS